MNNKTISEKIKMTAFELLISKGIKSFTMDELSKELRISKKTFYKIFPSKKSVIKIAIMANLKMIELKLKKIIDSDLPILQKINEVLFLAGSQMNKLKNEYFKEMKNLFPEMWVEIEKFRKEKIFIQIEKLFYEAKSKNIIRNEINIEVLVMMFEYSVLGIINPKVLSENSFSANEAMKSVISTIFYGALTEDSKINFDNNINN